MSQKSSVPQAVSFVSQVLKRDTQHLSSLRIDKVYFCAGHARHQLIHVIVGHLLGGPALNGLAGVWIAIQKGRRHPLPIAQTK